MKNAFLKQAVNFIKMFTNNIATLSHHIKDYFENGSFGMAVYPFLMHPCVRRTARLFIILFATLASFMGVYFLFAELVVILFSEASLPAYFRHTILTLLKSENADFSPLSSVIHSLFSLQGMGFWLVYIMAIFTISRHKYWLLSVLFAVAFSVGMSLIPSANVQLSEGGLQNFGASITYLIGNIAIFLAGIDFIKPQLKFIRRFSLFAGIIGAGCIAFTLFMPTPFTPILERLGIYSIMIWEILLGFALLKQK